MPMARTMMARKMTTAAPSQVGPVSHHSYLARAKTLGSIQHSQLKLTDAI